MGKYEKYIKNQWLKNGSIDLQISLQRKLRSSWNFMWRSICIVSLNAHTRVVNVCTYVLSHVHALTTCVRLFAHIIYAIFFSIIMNHPVVLCGNDIAIQPVWFQPLQIICEINIFCFPIPSDEINLLAHSTIILN